MTFLAVSVHGARWLRHYVVRRRVAGLAAEVAFWLFLSLLPLAAVGGMIAAKVMVGYREAVGSWLSGIPVAMRDFVTAELSKVAALKDGAFGPLVAMVFVWLAASGLHALFEAFDTMTHTPRSWLRKRLMALIACLSLSLGGGSMALLAGVVTWARGQGPDISPALAPFLSVTFRLVGGAFVIFASVAGLYSLGLPFTRRRSWPILPGAAFATVLQALLGFGYGLWVRTAGDGSAYLAGLATIGVTMTLTYLYVLSVLLGLAVNQWWRLLRRARALSRLRRSP